MATIPSWLKTLARRCGFDAVRRSDDPVLQELLSIHRELRLAPGDALLWEDRLPHPASMSHLRNLLREQSVDLVIDVGANVGQFAGMVRRLGYAGDLVSFEPQSAARARLQAAAAGDPRWTVRPEALGRVRGEAALEIFPDSTFSSLHAINALGRRRFGRLVEATGRETVAVVPLDSILGEIAPAGPRRILVKTDTQGNDLDVLAGAAETLRSARVVISEGSAMPIYENAPVLTDLTLAMERAGFALSGLYPTGHQPPPSLALLELDCYFVRAEPG
jgi:FkbM family methyltransferase